MYSRQCRRIAVSEHLNISSGERGFEGKSFSQFALEASRRNNLRHTAEKFEGGNVRAYPIVKPPRESHSSAVLIRNSESQ
jgi:hypothetical protein